MVPVEQRQSGNEVEHWDDAFQAMISTSDLRAVDVVGDREGLRRDVRRIASTLFCSSNIDRSIVTFAIGRTAKHWGLAEHDVDALVTTRLLQKTASLIRDLRWLGVEQPDPQCRSIELAA